MDKTGNSETPSHGFVPGGGRPSNLAKGQCLPMTLVLVVNNNPNNLPGSYTQQLIARVHEAGLQTYEARSVDDVNALAAQKRRCDRQDVGLIISCGSPVELTESVDLRAHVCKTTAAMLLFPEAPVVGICYGMQLLALLYGGLLKEQRETAHKGVWAEIRTNPGVKSRLLHGMSGFVQKASNYIFVETLPRHFLATAVDSRGRIMAMEHSHEHVYGIQWHPEVIGTQVGRSLLERIFALLGQQRSEGKELLLAPVTVKSVCLPDQDVCNLHEVDLELRKVVKELVTSAGKKAAVELGKVLAGKRKELMIMLRRMQPEAAVGSDGDLSSACALAKEELREVAAAWLNNPARAG